MHAVPIALVGGAWLSRRGFRSFIVPIIGGAHGPRLVQAGAVIGICIASLPALVIAYVFGAYFGGLLGVLFGTIASGGGIGPVVKILYSIGASVAIAVLWAAGLLLGAWLGAIICRFIGQTSPEQAQPIVQADAFGAALLRYWANHMRLPAKNIVLGMALVLIPLLAEGVSALHAQAPGSGVRLLLYWPVDPGLIVFALAAFICLNAYALRQRPAGFVLGALTGLPVTATWFGIAFLVVFQVHPWRGGQM